MQACVRSWGRSSQPLPTCLFVCLQSPEKPQFVGDTADKNTLLAITTNFPLSNLRPSLQSVLRGHLHLPSSHPSIGATPRQIVFTQRSEPLRFPTHFSHPQPTGAPRSWEMPPESAHVPRGRDREPQKSHRMDVQKPLESQTLARPGVPPWRGLGRKCWTPPMGREPSRLFPANNAIRRPRE